MNAAQRSPRSLRLTLLAAACLLPLLTLGACSRAHITPSHGRAFREAFAIQDANPNRGANKKSINGLDSQEAAIIAGSYRKALAPKGDVGNSGQQLLMVSPNHGGAAEVVAPSVPQ
jgi:hypothetical protein